MVTTQIRLSKLGNKVWVVNEEILQGSHGGLAGVPGLADKSGMVKANAKERIIMAWRLAVPG